MTDDTLIPDDPSGVQEVALRDALEERYLQYAPSTITGRALPDARDGLKPVQYTRSSHGFFGIRTGPGFVAVI